MNLKEYFEEKNGFGVLSTADNEGRVDSAAYAKPQFVEEDKIAFIMGDRLSHANITKNQYAVYLFKEDGPGYEGKRVFLKKDSETDNSDIIENICKINWPGPYCGPKYLKNSFLVTFKIESVLPLVIYDKDKKD